MTTETSRRRSTTRRKTTETKAPETQVSQSLAVKYRPKRLEDMVGQKAAVTVVTGMIKKRKFPGAFLIDGHTGTGKTTMARLIHRYINCETGNACGECSTCKTAPEHHMDFINISAGVNGKVDDIRALVKSSRVAPYSNKRIIVVDECIEGDVEVVLDKEGNRATIQDICDTPDKYTSVLSYNHETGQTEVQPITNRFVLEKPSEEVFDIEFDNGSTLKGVTGNHPVWCVNRNEYVHVQDLTEGDEVLPLCEP